MSIVIMSDVVESEKRDGVVDLLLACEHIVSIDGRSPVPSRIMCTDCMRDELAKTAAMAVTLPDAPSYRKPIAHESGWDGWASRHVTGMGAYD
jgi:hypothetical protein